MNFIEAIKLVKEKSIVHRKHWGEEEFLSQAIDESYIVKYNVDGRILPISIEDVLATDWLGAKIL